VVVTLLLGRLFQLLKIVASAYGLNVNQITGLGGIMSTLSVSQVNGSNILTLDNKNISYTLPSGLAVCSGISASTYYIPLPITPAITSNAVIHASLQVPDGITTNSIIYAKPFFSISSNQYIEVLFALPVTDVQTTIAWSIVALDSTPSAALSIMPS